MLSRMTEFHNLDPSLTSTTTSTPYVLFLLILRESGKPESTTLPLPPINICGGMTIGLCFRVVCQSVRMPCVCQHDISESNGQKIHQKLLDNFTATRPETFSNQ